MADCPGIYKLSKMKDGLLARIRVPGGILTSKQARCLSYAAKTYGNGIIDLTNRANIQLRGIKEQAIDDLAQSLLADKLMSHSSEHDRLRNITMDPFAGLCDEAIDCTSLVKQLDEALVKLEDPDLFSPKMAFVFDGGGKTNIGAIPHDFAYLAVSNEATNHQPKFQLSLAGRLTSLYITPETIIEEILASLERLRPYNGFANQSDIAEDQTKNIRIKNLLVQLGAEKLLEIIAPNQKAALLEQKQSTQVLLPKNLTAQKNTTKSVINLVSPTGRLTDYQAEGLAELAENYGCGELRLTTWQGVLLPSIEEDHIADIWEKAEAMGLLTQQSEQNLQIISCAGSEGCVYGGFETKLTALNLRDELSEFAMPNPVTIHLSACEKGCATRKSTAYLIMQKRNCPEICLYTNAGPDTEKPGKPIKKDQLISEIKKLV